MYFYHYNKYHRRTALIGLLSSHYYDGFIEVNWNPILSALAPPGFHDEKLSRDPDDDDFVVMTFWESAKRKSSAKIVSVDEERRVSNGVMKLACLCWVQHVLGVWTCDHWIPNYEHDATYDLPGCMGGLGITGVSVVNWTITARYKSTLRIPLHTWHYNKQVNWGFGAH